MPEDILLDNIKPKVFSNVEKENQKFETNKNRKALVYTVISSAIVLLVFLLVSFDSPIPDPPPPPPKEDFVEIEVDVEELKFEEEDQNHESNLKPLKQAAAPAGKVSASSKDIATGDPKAVEAPPNRVLTDNSQSNAANVKNPTTKNPHSKYPGEGTKPVANPTNTRRAVRMGPPKPGSTTPGNNPIPGDGRGNEISGPPGGGGTERLGNGDLTNGGGLSGLANQSGTNYEGRVTVIISVNADGNYTGIITRAKANNIDNKGRYKSAIEYVENTLVKRAKFPKSNNSNRRATLYFDFKYD